VVRAIRAVVDDWANVDAKSMESYTETLARSGTIERLPASTLVRLPDGCVGFFAFCNENVPHMAALSSSMSQRQNHPIPTFVPVLSLCRVRPKGRKHKRGEEVVYKTRYDSDAAKGRTLAAGSVHDEPLEMFDLLAQLHWSRMLDGWSHFEADNELKAFTGVPAGWRGAHLFTGGFAPNKLSVARTINRIILISMLVLVFVGVDRMHYTVDYYDVTISMLINFFVTPTIEVIRGLILGVLLFEAASKLQVKEQAKGEENAKRAMAHLKAAMVMQVHVKHVGHTDASAEPANLRADGSQATQRENASPVATVSDLLQKGVGLLEGAGKAAQQAGTAAQQAGMSCTTKGVELLGDAQNAVQQVGSSCSAQVAACFLAAGLKDESRGGRRPCSTFQSFETRPSFVDTAHVFSTRRDVSAETSVVMKEHIAHLRAKLDLMREEAAQDGSASLRDKEAAQDGSASL